MFDISTAASWIQFIILLVSIITIGLKVGRFVGTQEQINTNQEKVNKRVEEDIKKLDCKIDAIGTDVDFIKGKIS